jgi:hypothetical protein
MSTEGQVDQAKHRQPMIFTDEEYALVSGEAGYANKRINQFVREGAVFYARHLVKMRNRKMNQE